MGFQQGLSGLNASAKALDAIGNNVANSGTVGFKSARGEFADVFAASLAGAGASQIGIGTAVANVAQQFTQGNITVSNNALDVAINGGGMFIMSNNGAISYSRNGQFQIDKSGYIINAAGYRLQGYPADFTVDPAGIIVQSTPTDIYIDPSDLTPKTTDSITVGLNLDSRESVPVPAFSRSDPLSYNSSTSVTVYDSLGVPQVVTMYFRKAAANSWDIYYRVTGPQITVPVDLGPDNLNFTSTGGTTGTTTFTQAGINTGTGANPMAFDIDFGGSTQFGSTFGVTQMIQNGFSSGRLAGVNISPDGVVQGRFTNGQSRNMGQITLAKFNNPNGLLSIGGNQWQETSESGAPLVGAPGTGSNGVVQSAAVEESNVDLTAELVNMITQQRAYQANAQSIKTQDQVLQTLVNLR